VIKDGHCVDEHLLRCDIGRVESTSTCYAVTSVGVESRSRCDGVTSEVVAMSLAARCKRRSKKADYYCLLLRTEMAGATKGIDKHLLRCDIGRGRKSFSV
jgi:hypothetical protein